MLRRLILLLATLLAPIGAMAQGGTTFLSGQVLDPAGNPYKNSQVNISFYDPGTSGKLPLLNGSTFQTQYAYQTDSFGNLPNIVPIALPDNGVIGTSSGELNTLWTFTIVYQDRATSFSTKLNINCASNLPAICTGNTINITSTLQAVSAPLPGALFATATSLLGPGTISGNYTGTFIDTGVLTFTNPSNTLSGTSSTFTNPGVFTNTQMNFNFSNLVNNLSPTTEYHGINNNSTLNTTSGGSFGVNVPNTSTVYQANGVEGYAACATINTNCVGGYFQARPLVNGHLSIWGINPVASDIGFTGTTVVAMESDANATSTTTTIQNIQMNGSFTAQPGTALGIRCSIPAGIGRYSSCFSTDMGASNGIGMSLGSIDTGGVHCTTSCNGQQITISGFNASGTAKSVFLDSDLNGNFRIYPQTGVGIQAASALSPRGILEVSTGGAVPDALNANIAANVNITDGSNTGIQLGFSDTAALRGFIQARNNIGTNNTAYPLTLNEKGGNVGVNTSNPTQPLDVIGNVRSSTGFISGAGTSPNLTQGQFCGTTSACSHTTLTSPQIVMGSAPLVSGTPSTVTISGISPTFTSSTSYICIVTDATTAANNLLKVVNVSSSSFTITGPNTLTDTINYICTGN